jgi:hypothetical protein
MFDTYRERGEELLRTHASTCDACAGQLAVEALARSVFQVARPPDDVRVVLPKARFGDARRRALQWSFVAIAAIEIAFLLPRVSGRPILVIASAALLIATMVVADMLDET